MRPRSISRYVPPGDRRPPLGRILGLIAEKSVDRQRRIFAGIRQQLNDAPEPAEWIDAACTLRDRGTITADTTIYMVEIFLECITAEAADTDRELLDLYDQIEAIERAHGLEDDEYWRIGEGPPEWTALQDQWNRRSDAINGEYLRAHEHPDLAMLFEGDPAALSVRSAQGYVDLWGEPDLPLS